VVEEEQSLKNVDIKQTFEVEMVHEKMVENQIMEKKTSYVRGQYGGDHQPTKKNDTPIERKFVVGDGRRNSRATTIGNCATK